MGKNLSQEAILNFNSPWKWLKLLHVLSDHRKHPRVCKLLVQIERHHTKLTMKKFCRMEKLSLMKKKNLQDPIMELKRQGKEHYSIMHE